MPAKGQRLYSEEWRFIRKRWNGMRGRCYGSNSAFYKERRIDIFKEWDDFPVFFAYIINNIGMPPRDGCRYTLDRINNDLGYYPGNLRWADYKTQERNRSSNIFLEYKNKKALLIEFAEEYNISASILYDRIFRQGWSIEQALTIPKLSRSQRFKPYRSKAELIIEINGEKKPLAQIAKENNINRGVLYDRLKRNWSLQRAIMTPISKGNASLYKAKKFLINGKNFTMKEICKKYKLKRATLDYRLKIGWSLEDAINIKPDLGNKKLKNKDSTIANMSQK